MTAVPLFPSSSSQQPGIDSSPQRAPPPATERHYAFEATTAHIAKVVAVLRGIAFESQAQCHVTRQGIQVTVEQAQCMAAHVYLQSSLFSTFAVHAATESEPAVLFGLDLSVLIDCLSLLAPQGASSVDEPPADDERPSGDVGGDSAERLVFIGLTLDRSRLILRVAQGATETECAIVTIEPETPLDLLAVFRQAPLVSKVLMPATVLKDALTDLARTESAIDITVAPEALRLEAASPWGSMELEYPLAAHVVESLQCVARRSVSFRRSMLLHVRRILGISYKVNMKLSAQGVLSIQCMVPMVGDENCFVEFVIMPLDEADDDEAPTSPRFTPAPAPTVLSVGGLFGNLL